MARGRYNKFRPIETVYLPGDRELYREAIAKEGRRIAPHDHQEYYLKKRAEESTLRLQDLLRRWQQEEEAPVEFDLKSGADVSTESKHKRL